MSDLISYDRLEPVIQNSIDQIRGLLERIDLCITKSLAERQAVREAENKEGEWHAALSDYKRSWYAISFMFAAGIEVKHLEEDLKNLRLFLVAIEKEHLYKEIENEVKQRINEANQRIEEVLKNPPQIRSLH